MKRGKMMRLKDMQYWRREWEAATRKALSLRDMDGYRFSCARLWTLEFIAGYTDDPAYKQPLERMPWQWTSPSIPEQEDPRDEEEAIFDRAAARQCPAFQEPKSDV